MQGLEKQGHKGDARRTGGSIRKNSLITMSNKAPDINQGRLRGRGLAGEIVPGFSPSSLTREQKTPGINQACLRERGQTGEVVPDFSPSGLI